MNGIHQLQRIIGMRILRREHPDIFPIKINNDSEDLLKLKGGL